MICHKIYQFYKSENGGQNSTCWKIGVKILQCLKKGRSIFYIRPQKYRSKFYIGWKGPSLPVTQNIVSTPPVFILRRAQGPDSI